MRHKIGGVHKFKCQVCGYSEDHYVNYKQDNGQILCPNCQFPLMMIKHEPRLSVRSRSGEWDWKKGYRTGIDDPVKEVKFDMMRLEQSATETGNLKEFRKKQKALKYFAEANSEILQ